LALTDSDGNLSTTYTYDPFGNVSANGTPNSNPYQFTGRENDEIGLDYNRSRFYSLSLARFVSQDPTDFYGGLNLYAYVEDQPISSSDPFGLQGGPWHPPAGVKTKCTWADPCDVLDAKMWVLQKMIGSHEGWDRTMPSPRGGGRHAQEIGQLYAQFAECQAIYAEKCPDSNPTCQNSHGRANNSGLAGLLAFLAWLASHAPVPE